MKTKKNKLKSNKKLKGSSSSNLGKLVRGIHHDSLSSFIKNRLNATELGKLERTSKNFQTIQNEQNPTYEKRANSNWYEFLDKRIDYIKTKIDELTEDKENLLYDLEEKLIEKKILISNGNNLKINKFNAPIAINKELKLDEYNLVIPSNLDLIPKQISTINKIINMSRLRFILDNFFDVEYEIENNIEKYNMKNDDIIEFIYDKIYYAQSEAHEYILTPNNVPKSSFFLLVRDLLINYIEIDELERIEQEYIDRIEKITNRLNL